MAWDTIKALHPAKAQSSPPPLLLSCFCVGLSVCTWWTGMDWMVYLGLLYYAQCNKQMTASCVLLLLLLLVMIISFLLLLFSTYCNG